MNRTSATSIGGIRSNAATTSSTACQRVTGFDLFVFAERTCATRAAGGRQRNIQAPRQRDNYSPRTINYERKLLKQPHSRRKARARAEVIPLAVCASLP